MQEKIDQARKDMVELSSDFLVNYGDYYRGKNGDRELLELVTQPFWQSMRLSKRRLVSKGLTMELEVLDQEKEKRNPNEIFNVKKDNKDIVGTGVQAVLTRRLFLKGNKKIYDRKEAEISTISMVKADVENDMVECPNCGHVGTVQSYIDGCDACGSAFSVKDFQTKVSAFSLEENSAMKLIKTVRRTLLVLAILTGIIMLLGLVSIIAFFAMAALQQIGMSIMGPVWGIMAAMDLVPLGFRCLITIPFLYVFLVVVIAKHYQQRVAGTDIVKQMIPYFSAEDFCQNLEYKLRNIHMTDNASEVAAFATCSLESAVSKYSDVIDCNVTRYKFTDVHEAGAGYAIDVEVTMRLTKYNGRRIRTEYERIILSLYGKRNLIQKKTIALREYKCSGCGSSINILEGSVCKSCGSVFDYGDYGWVIEKYEIDKKPANICSFLRFGIVVAYILVFAMHMVFLGVDKEGDNWFSGSMQLAEISQRVDTIYDAVVLPDEIDEETILLNVEDDINSRMYEYSTSDGIFLAEQYKDYLIAEDFFCVDTDNVADTFILYRLKEIDGETGYLKITVTGRKNSIEVLMEMVETIED